MPTSSDVLLPRMKAEKGGLDLSTASLLPVIKSPARLSSVKSVLGPLVRAVESGTLELAMAMAVALDLGLACIQNEISISPKADKP